MKQKRKYIYLLPMILLGITLFLTGCGCSYAKPTTGANMGLFQGTLNTRHTLQPMAQLPVVLAIARIQGPMHSYPNNTGYLVMSVNQPPMGLDEDVFKNLRDISQVVPVNKLLVAGPQNSANDLRSAALSLKADMLFVFTLDTQQTQSDWSSPLSLYSLGLSPSVKVEVTTSAMGMLIDTQTGYVYGVLEATSYKKQIAAYMTCQNAWDQCRKVTEKKAVEEMNKKFETMWNGVLGQYEQGVFVSNAPRHHENIDSSEYSVPVEDDEPRVVSEAEQVFWK